MLRDKVRKFVGARALDKRLRLMEHALHAASHRRDEAGEQRLQALDERLHRQMAALHPEQAAPEPGLDLARLGYLDLVGTLEVPTSPPGPVPVTSGMCIQADFARDAFRYWMAQLRIPFVLHRKFWEYYFIVQALHERGFLAEGRTGLGFGVGQEPIPAFFASQGCRILATDQSLDAAQAAGWTASNEHAGSTSGINNRDLCDPGVLQERVSFREVDMNAIPRDLDGRFDFCWSACCLEHLGSLKAGLAFIENSLHTLKPGGIAVHTTEFNLSSNEETFESPALSLFRRRDMEELASHLTRQGYRVSPFRWDRGAGLIDGYVDLPPYQRNRPHLRLRIAEFDCTSIGIIVERPA